jgi:hypothetical protein
MAEAGEVVERGAMVLEMEVAEREAVLGRIKQW